jgi:uncharacterized membrane protein
MCVLGGVATLYLALVLVHILAAISLVGGSLFIWLVAVPASRSLGLPEAQRTLFIGQLAKRFGTFVYGTLAMLVVTGVLLAFLRLGSPEFLFRSPSGQILFVKMVMVAVVLVLLYVHNVRFGRRIADLARTGQVDRLQRLRRRSRPVAYVNVALLVTIALLGVTMRFV